MQYSNLETLQQRYLIPLRSFWKLLVYLYESAGFVGKKFWEPPRQHFGSFEHWQNFGNSQKIGKVLKLGVPLTLRYLLTHLLLIQTKLALERLGP